MVKKNDEPWTDIHDVKTLYISIFGAAYLTESYPIRERKKGAHICNIVPSGSDHQVGSACLSEVFLDKLDIILSDREFYLRSKIRLLPTTTVSSSKKASWTASRAKNATDRGSAHVFWSFYAAKSGCIFALLTTKKQYDVLTSSRKPYVFQTRTRTKRCNPSQSAQRQITKIPRVSEMILTMSQHT